MQNSFLYFLLFISFATFSQKENLKKNKDSIAILLKEYKKTTQQNLPKKAFLLAEKAKNDSLLKITYIKFGIRSYLNKDSANLALSEQKLHHFYKKTKDTLALAKRYYYKALFFKLQSKPDSIFYYFNESKNISVQLKDSLEVARRLLSMSALQYNEKDYLGSESSVIEGLRFVEPLGEVFFTGLLYERLGNVLFATGRQEESRKNYYKFFEFQKKSPSLNMKYEKARLYNHLAKTYEGEKDYLKAIDYFNKSLSIDSIKFNSTYRYETALEGFSYNNFMLGNKKMALKGYLEVLESREKRKHKRAIVVSHSVLAQIYESNNQTQKAIFHAKKGIKLAKELNHSQRTLQNLYLLSNLVKGEKGRQFLLEHFALNDSLFNRERNLKNQFAKVRYETEKKDIENDHLKQENIQKQLLLEREKQQKTIGWLIAGASILFIGFGTSVVLSRRKKLLFQSKLKQVEAREKERQQIAKSLHDEVAGDIRMLHKKLINSNLQEESKELDRVKENVRSLSHQLSSVSFNAVSFKDQVINLVSDYFDADFRIKIKEINSVEWKELDNSIKRTLFLSIRECLQNIDKHAEATNVIFSFNETKNAISIEIIDNGKGFNIKASKKGIGLRNLKERVEEIGGDFSLKSELEKGTEIKIEIPKNGS